jgi:hypothetical protein
MSRILGPTLGGYAMAVFGVAGNFFLNGLSFVAVLFALTRIRYPEEKLVRHEGLLDSLISGFRYVRSIPQMHVLMWMIAMASFLSIPFLTFIPFFARDQLHVGESGLGLLLACFGHRGGAGRGDCGLERFDAASRADYCLLRCGSDGDCGGLLLFAELPALGVLHVF